MRPHAPHMYLQKYALEYTVINTALINVQSYKHSPTQHAARNDAEKLRLKSCMPWANGQVRQMIYYAKRDQIITAGTCRASAYNVAYKGVQILRGSMKPLLHVPFYLLKRKHQAKCFGNSVFICC